MLSLVLVNHDNLPVDFALINEAETPQHFASIDTPQLFLRLAQVANIDGIIVSINNINHTYNPSESFTMFCYQV
jgi:benzoyl-CoA reductase/2-hydroxyglutaryl-CoA dehydratase subunit BcrC/BadD/HgdB